MKKRSLRCFAALLSLVLLILSGCYGYADELQLLGESELPYGPEILPDIEANSQYPVCLDQRLHFGMTDTEIRAVLGEPNEVQEYMELTTTTMMYYTWTIGEQEAELTLCLLHTQAGLRLNEVYLDVYFADDPETGVITALERLVDETYGEFSGFSWEATDSDLIYRRFMVEQEGNGLSGWIMTDSQEVWFGVQLELPELSDMLVLMPDMEPMTQYPVCLDQRLHFGMTDEETRVVLGEPSGTGEETEFFTVTTLYYPWSPDGQEAELDLSFLTVGGELVLYSVKLYVYCDEGAEDEIVTKLEGLVNETYENLPGFAWIPVETDVTEVWMFMMDQGDTGITGDIMTSPGMVYFTCIAGQAALLGQDDGVPLRAEKHHYGEQGEQHEKTRHHRSHGH